MTRHSPKSSFSRAAARSPAWQAVAQAMVLGVLLVVAPVALAQDKKQARQKEMFGYWELICETPPGASEKKCSLKQDVIDEEKSNLGLSIQFFFSSEGHTVLRTLVPLGVFIPAGLGLKIDDELIGDKPFWFERCHPFGCVSTIIAKDTLLDKFRKGKRALFIIVISKEVLRAIPIELEGFTKGLQRLTTLSKPKQKPSQ